MKPRTCPLRGGRKGFVSCFELTMVTNRGRARQRPPRPLCLTVPSSRPLSGRVRRSCPWTPSLRPTWPPRTGSGMPPLRSCLPCRSCRHLICLLPLLHLLDTAGKIPWKHHRNGTPGAQPKFRGQNCCGPTRRRLFANRPTKRTASAPTQTRPGWASSERHTQSQSQRQRQEFQQGGNERHGRITDTSRRRRNGHDGTVRGTERDADSQPHTAPGQLRQGLVLDDDGHLPRREVGRAGVSAEARRQRHRHALPHRGLLSGRGDNAAGGPHRAAHLDGLRARERRGGQGP